MPYLYVVDFHPDREIPAVRKYARFAEAKNGWKVTEGNANKYIRMTGTRKSFLAEEDMLKYVATVLSVRELATEERLRRIKEALASSPLQIDLTTYQ